MKSSFVKSSNWSIDLKIHPGIVSGIRITNFAIIGFSGVVSYIPNNHLQLSISSDILTV